MSVYFRGKSKALTGSELWDTTLLTLTKRQFGGTGHSMLTADRPNWPDHYSIFLYLPENQTNVLRVKIGDFGTSKRIPLSNASTYLKITTGTQGYMAPEVHDTSKPKTNRVDIWSLGCVLYRMFTGNLLFNDSVEVWKYALTAFFSPLVLDNVGFSTPCVSFLLEILQPIPEDRPSAEDCQKKAWIISEVSGPEYSIEKDLYTRLSKINQQAPNVHSFPNMVANRTADSSSLPWEPLVAIIQLRREAGYQVWVSSPILFSPSISLFLLLAPRSLRIQLWTNNLVLGLLRTPNAALDISSSPLVEHKLPLHFIFTLPEFEFYYKSRFGLMYS